MVQQPAYRQYWLLLVVMALTCNLAGCVTDDGMAQVPGVPSDALEWRYEFSAPQERVVPRKGQLLQVAATTGSTVEVREKGQAGEGVVTVIITGHGSLADLQRLIFNPEALITPLTRQAAQLRIKGVVSSGREITLTLASNITTGYRWRVDEPSAMVVREAPAARSAPNGLTLGGSGRQGFILSATAGGEKVIVLNYRRAWERLGEPSAILSLTVPGELPATLDLSEP